MPDKKSKGFTLVELLVVISIIAVLSAIGIVIYSGVIKQGRDSKRQSDLRSVQSALEQYFTDKFSYPAGITFGSSLADGGRTYMNSLPTDPLASPQPQYSYTASPAVCDGAGTRCDSYCLYALLENSSTTQLGSCPASGSYNFAVSPP